MTPKAFKALALSLPEAVAAPHFERTSFRVGKKIFATMTPDGAEAMVKLSTKDGIDALLSSRPDVFFSHGTWTTRNGALGVRLGKASEAMLTELVIDAWKGIAPKRAVAAFDAKRSSRRRK